MLHQVERLNAYEDQRQLRLLSTVQNPEGIVESSEALDKAIGTIYEWGQYIPPKFELNEKEGLDPDFDRAGLRALKAKHGA